MKRQKALNVRMGRPHELVPPVEPLWSIDRELAKMESEASSASDETRIAPRPARPYNLSEAGLESLRASIRRRFPKYALLLMSQMRPAPLLKPQRTKVPRETKAPPRRVADGVFTPRTPRARRDAASVKLILDRLRNSPVR